MSRSILTLVVLLLAPLALRCEDLPRLLGTVTKVVDGDTIDVKLTSGPIRIRLHGIDTPEKGQPWGKEASAALSRLVVNRKVEIEPFEQDRYERLIGRVYLDDTDINGELIKQGHAWAYRRYMMKADARYCAFAESARAHKAGLWSLIRSEQIPPWEYRHRKKTDPPWHPVPLSEKLCIAQIGKKIQKIGFISTQEP